MSVDGAEITLDGSYEGTRALMNYCAAWLIQLCPGEFQLCSAVAVVNVRPGAEDPEGGLPPRDRTVDVHEAPDGVYGTTFWGERRSTTAGSIWVGSPEGDAGETVLNL